MGNAEAERVARCACGDLTLTTRGEPLDVYLCSCKDCQRWQRLFLRRAVFQSPP
jgi:hypothetical protein